MKKERNETLQRLCRDYLGRLRYVASKHDLLPQLNNLIAMNKRRECVSTEREVQMLSRMVDDERIKRTDVPSILGKSYNQCYNDDDFSRIKKLAPVGIYSKVSTILYADSLKRKKMLKNRQNIWSKRTKALPLQKK